MTPTHTTQDNGPDRPLHRITWRARVLVLGGLALATVYTAVALVLGAGAEHIGPLWLLGGGVGLSGRLPGGAGGAVEAEASGPG
ncbi:MAG: hypothetical protein OXE53_17860 [Deltaproteobacteria bacterium]|nr:hypothetical protein [Deltaproteobacteria bacterium]